MNAGPPLWYFRARFDSPHASYARLTGRCTAKHRLIRRRLKPTTVCQRWPHILICQSDSLGVLQTRVHPEKHRLIRCNVGMDVVHNPRHCRYVKELVRRAHRTRTSTWIHFTLGVGTGVRSVECENRMSSLDLGEANLARPSSHASPLAGAAASDHLRCPSWFHHWNVMRSRT